MRVVRALMDIDVNASTAQAQQQQQLLGGSLNKQPRLPVPQVPTVEEMVAAVAGANLISAQEMLSLCDHAAGVLKNEVNHAFSACFS
jgi:hypothetical protein